MSAQPAETYDMAGELGIVYNGCHCPHDDHDLNRVLASSNAGMPWDQACRVVYGELTTPKQETAHAALSNAIAKTTPIPFPGTIIRSAVTSNA